MRWWIPTAMLLGLAGCIERDAFSCSESSQCRIGEGGRCEANGQCTHVVEPERCESGRIWSRTAGQLAGQCWDAAEGGTTSTGNDDAAAECGNGVLDPGEQCDDDNTIDGDGCNADCMPSGRARWVAMPSVSEFENTLGAVTLADNGDVLAAGYASVEAAEDEFDSDQYELLFVRADGEGEVFEVLTETRAGRDQLRCVIAAPDGTVWVGGERRGTGAQLWLGEVVDGAFVERLDYGAFESEQTAGQDCAMASDGRIVIVGMIQGSDSGESFESWDRLIVRDALSAAPSGLALPGAGELRDLAYAVVPLAEDELLVAGTTSPDPADVGTFSQRWVQRFDAADGEVWSYVVGGAGNAQEEVFGLALAGDRLYAVGSEGFGNGDQEREWIGVLHLDRGIVDYDGDVLDDGALPMPARFSDVAVYPNGDVIAVGSAGASGQAVGIAVRLDPSGTDVRWTATDYGVPRIADVVTAPDGAAIVVGSSVERGADGPAWIARIAP